MDRSIRLFAIMSTLLLGACAHQESYDLGEYVRQTAANDLFRADAEHAMWVAGPVLENCTAQASVFSQVPLVERVQFAQHLAEAIGRATDTTVTRIIFVDPEVANVASGGGAMDGSMNPGCDRCRIGKSYVAFLTDRHESTVMNAIGRDGWSKLQYRVRSTLKGVCEPGVQETVFYHLAYAAYVSYGDDRSLDAVLGFETLMRHLSFAVPLGEKADEPGAWYVKVR